MKVFADLHCHSTASDGQFSPAEVVKKASMSGVELLALTDHDTLAGTEAALEQARNMKNIQVIRGIELAAKEYSKFHIVGLNVSNQTTALTKLCEKQRQSREDRKYSIIKMLKDMGVEVTAEEVDAKAAGAANARPHFARVMIDKGYVKTSEEAFSRYLDGPEYHSIDFYKVCGKECVEAIHAAGGKAVLAHPYQLKLQDDELDDLLKKMKSWGLDGIECYYLRHTPQQTRLYLELAKKYQLHISSAGDFHGPKVHQDDRFFPNEIDVKWIFE